MQPPNLGGDNDLKSGSDARCGGLQVQRITARAVVVPGAAGRVLLVLLTDGLIAN